MLDDPQQFPHASVIPDIVSESKDLPYEARLAYIRSSEFTRKLCEHVKRAFRRAIEKGKADDLTSQPAANE